MSDTAEPKQADESLVPLMAPPTSNNKIILEVGERRFVTSRTTLTAGSGYFASHLSGRWNDAQADGSYFIDADPALFEHVLQFLRRGVLPVFYDRQKGHDEAKYAALLEEAKYFLVEELRTWLEHKRYRDAVSIHHSIFETEGLGAMREIPTHDIDVACFPRWTSRKVYLCPRRIHVHRGDPSACGRLCRKAQGDAEDEYQDEPVLKTLVMQKETVFKRSVCIEEDR